MFLNLDGELALIVRQLRRERRIRPPEWCPMCKVVKRVRRALTSSQSLAPQPGDRAWPPLREYPYP